MNESAAILPFARNNDLCDACGKQYRRQSVRDGQPAYCNYRCGCTAQPDSVLVKKGYGQTN